MSSSNVFPAVSTILSPVRAVLSAVRGVFPGVSNVPPVGRTTQPGVRGVFPGVSSVLPGDGATVAGFGIVGQARARAHGVSGSFLQHGARAARERLTCGLVAAGLCISVQSAATAQQCNTALRLDGLNDFVEGLPAPSLTANPHTIECWVRLIGTTNAGVIAGQHNSTAGNDCYRGYSLGASATGFNYQVDPTGCGNSNGLARAAAAGTWHHVAGTFDGTTQILYINGEEVGRRSATMSTATRFVIGAQYSFAFNRFTNFFAGDVDEVRVWSYARTQSEIASNMFLRLNEPIPGLLAYWPFDEGSGSVTADVSGSNRTGQLGTAGVADNAEPLWIQSFGITQPQDVATCPQQSAQVNVYTFPPSAATTGWAWEIEDATTIGGWRPLVDGVLTIDGVEVGLMQGTSTGTVVFVPSTTSVTGGTTIRVRVTATQACSSLTTTPSVIAVTACDCIDFNNNVVFPEDQDIVDYLDVLAGGECAACNDIDFNNNGVFPEDQDVVDFFNVLAGGTCP